MFNKSFSAPALTSLGLEAIVHKRGFVMAGPTSIVADHTPPAPLRSGAESAGAWETRRKIIETAERLYRQYGYRKTTVADIAGELGMSPANVYRFFASKDAISAAVAAMVIDEIVEVATRAAAGDVPALARFARLVRAVHLHSRERLLVDRKMHEMVRISIDEDWPVVVGYVERMKAVFAELIAEGTRRGEFDVPDPRIAGECAFGACSPFFHPVLIEKCLERDLAPELEGMIRFLARALGGDPAAVPAA